MPSEAAKKRQAKKKAAAQSRGKPKPAVDSTENGVENSSATENGASVKLDLSNRSCTGVLASHEQSRDVKIENFSITFHGVELLTDTKLELNCGRRYGLLGLNGCGKLFDVFLSFPSIRTHRRVVNFSSGQILDRRSSNKSFVNISISKFSVYSSRMKLISERLK